MSINLFIVHSEASKIILEIVKFEESEVKPKASP